MEQKKKTGRPTNEEAKVKELTPAAEWAHEHAPVEGGKSKCPWCGWKYTFDEEGDKSKQAMIGHFIRKHETALQFAYLQPELGFDAYSIMLNKKENGESVVDPEEGEFEVTDYFYEDRDDILYIPADIKARAKSKGSELYWVAERNIDRYKDMGMTFVPRPVDERTRQQRSTEDSHLKAREMVCMEIPAKLVRKRKEHKRRLIEAQGDNVGRMEDISIKSDAGERVYDHFISRGLSHDNAMRRARAAEKGERMNIDLPGRGENHVEHKR